MTKFDEFFAKEGALKTLHATMPLPNGIKEKINAAVANNLPQWVKDLMPNQEKKDLMKDFVDGRMTALSIGNKEMLDGFAAKYGFEYETPKANVLMHNLDKSRDR